MICKNCGAHFEDHLPKCPYCGAFHYAGARKEYMGKLEDMKEDLDDLHETVPQMYKTELKNQTKQVRKTMLIIAVVLGVLVVLFFVSSFLPDSAGSSNAKEALLFTTEAYPVADDYYEAGDYEGLLDFYQTSLMENENADFYDWEHYPFLICYENLTFFREAAANFGSENFSDFDLPEIFYCYIANRYHQKGYPMDETDQQLVSSFDAEMENFIGGLNLTEKEAQSLNDLLNSPEYPSWEEIENFSKQVYQRMF